MANWQAVQQGLSEGFEIGQKTGGKFAGLASVISKVADRLRNERQQKEALSLLGQTEGIKAQYGEYKPKTKEEALDFEREKAGISAESPKNIFSEKRKNLIDSTRIREEFIKRPEVEEYNTVKASVNAMDSLLKKGGKNKVSLDQGLITMYNKLTDPNSVVRESEYARTPQNLPMVNRIVGAYEKIQKGGAGLTDQDREALVIGAKIIANERGKIYQGTLDEYKNLAKDYGIEENLITRGVQPHRDYDIGLKNPGKIKKYQVGQTISANGKTYIVIGGDPNDPDIEEVK